MGRSWLGQCWLPVQDTCQSKSPELIRACTLASFQCMPVSWQCTKVIRTLQGLLLQLPVNKARDLPLTSACLCTGCFDGNQLCWIALHSITGAESLDHCDICVSNAVAGSLCGIARQNQCAYIHMLLGLNRISLLSQVTNEVAVRLLKKTSHRKQANQQLAKQSQSDEAQVKKDAQ